MVGEGEVTGGTEGNETLLHPVSDLSLGEGLDLWLPSPSHGKEGKGHLEADLDDVQWADQGTSDESRHRSCHRHLQLGVTPGICFGIIADHPCLWSIQRP